MNILPFQPPAHNSRPVLPATKAGTLRISAQYARECPFDGLTAALILAQHRAGTLNPQILEALLAAVDLRA